MKQEKQTITFIFAHPDDEAIPFGLPAQLAQEGHDVHLIALTNGSLGAHDHLSRRHVARTRKKEFQKAAEILGAKVHIMGIPDGAISPFPPRQKQKLLRVVRDINPDIAIIHNRDDYHADHTSGNQLAQWALFHRPDGSIRTRRGLFHKIPPTTKSIAVYEADTQGSQTWKSIYEDNGRDTENLSSVNMIIRIGAHAIQKSADAFLAHKSQLSPRPDGKVDYVTLAVMGSLRRGQQAGYRYGVGLTFIPFGGYAFSAENKLAQLAGKQNIQYIR